MSPRTHLSATSETVPACRDRTLSCHGCRRWCSRCLSASGCAQYQFVLVEPVERIITERRNEVVPLEPMEYRLASLDNEFLVVRVINPSDAVMEFVDDRTYVVDPDGETHRLGGAIIAPHASITIVLPPPPRVYQVHSRYSSYWHFGHDRWYGRAWPYWPPHRFGFRGYRDPFYYGYGGFYDFPRTYYVTEYPPGYWEWETRRVRLHLAYRQGEKTFEQQLVFLRRRVD